MAFTAEDMFLLECLRTQRDPEAVRKVRQMAGRPQDWQYLLRTAARNHIAPLIYDCLRKLEGGDAVPAWAMRTLEQEYHRMGFRNARNYTELANLLQSLKDRGVEAIVLKGAALAETVWKNIALRPMYDIDVLVRKHDLVEAERTLVRLGYTPSGRPPPNGCPWDQYYHLPPYYKLDPRIAVEIHHNIVHPRKVFPLDFDVGKFWERARSAKIAGVETQILSPEDTIIHLCLHQCKYDPFLEKIKNLLDLAYVIEFHRNRIHWDTIVKEAERTGTAKFVYYTLLFVETILAAGIEKQVFRRLKTQFTLMPFEDPLLKGVLRRNLLLRDEGASVFPTWILIRIAYELLRKGPSRDRVRSILKTLFLPPAKSLAGSPEACVSARACALLWLRRLSKVSHKVGGRIIAVVRKGVAANSLK